MFERFSESARRVLFFARYEVTQHGGTAIEPEHILLGVLRNKAATILRFARPRTSAEALRRRLADAVDVGEQVATSVEIPFSANTKKLLETTPGEADRLENKWIVSEHLVIGVLTATEGTAALALRDAGVDPEAVREYLRTNPIPDDSPRAVDSQMVAFASPRSPSVCRQWKGVVKAARAEDYLAHLRHETIPALAHIEGFLTYSVMRRDVEDGIEFQVLTMWRSLEAIEAFAGADVTRAVVPPAAQALMVRYDDRAIHYQVVL